MNKTVKLEQIPEDLKPYLIDAYADYEDDYPGFLFNYSVKRWAEGINTGDNVKLLVINEKI